VLRSGDRPGVEQELWALLTLYQLLRMAMVTAVETRPGTNPDRASFTTAIGGRGDDLRDAAASVAAGEGVGVEDIVVSNDRAVETVAREVMSWLGWL
jgi:hypothetical protein